MSADCQIQSYKLLTTLETSELASLLESMVANDSKEIIIVPDPGKKPYFRAILLQKYYTSALRSLTGVRTDIPEEPFHSLMIDPRLIRAFCSSLTRRLIPPNFHEQKKEEKSMDDSLDFIFDDDTVIENSDPNLDFLKANTPAGIERALNEMVIGQPELTAAVADFLYYHALRQLHPELPMRPLLISGPSGSGKTEVWRAAKKLYGNIFPIKIADGSNLTCDGWAGNYKLSTYITGDLLGGGILVVDEFDKMARPKHSSKGDNVSLDMQSEFLKLLEGEYMLTSRKQETRQTSRLMGIVLIGAFEDIRNGAKKEEPTVAPIGFCSAAPATPAAVPTGGFTDEELISYGLMPEIVGRIAVRCTTRFLNDNAYLEIIRGPHSRVAQIGTVLAKYGITVSDIISDRELLEMVATSKSNRTGVRWVSAQVETRLLNAIRKIGLFHDEPISHCA